MYLIMFQSGWNGQVDGGRKVAGAAAFWGWAEPRRGGGHGRHDSAVFVSPQSTFHKPHAVRSQHEHPDGTQSRQAQVFSMAFTRIYPNAEIQNGIEGKVVVETHYKKKHGLKKLHILNSTLFQVKW